MSVKGQVFKGSYRRQAFDSRSLKARQLLSGKKEE
jgi:hypothetical protein